MQSLGHILKRQNPVKGRPKNLTDVGKLLKNWPKLAGRFHEISFPIRLHKNTAVVRAMDEPTMLELSFYEQEMLHNINQCLNKNFKKLRIEVTGSFEPLPKGGDIKEAPKAVVTKETTVAENAALNRLSGKLRERFTSILRKK